jgi:5-hydroxyisourate hydrolase
MSGISTHVLDTARGRAAAGVAVTLEQLDAQHQWRHVGSGVTDQDGRVRTLLADDVRLVAGEYRLTFATREYFEATGMSAFYPSVTVTIEAAAGQTHYHVPLLLSPFGYTTYRGT